jgi:DNA-binding protein HU-beta
MNKDELIEAVATKTGLPKKDIDLVLKATGEVAQAVVANGDEVVLPGIGKLSVIEKAARIGRNPQTGAEIQIAAKKAPKFGAAKALKDAAAG